MLRKGKKHLSIRFGGSVNRDVELYIGSATRKKLRDLYPDADNRSLMATVAASNEKAPELKPGRTQAHRGRFLSPLVRRWGLPTIGDSGSAARCPEVGAAPMASDFEGVRTFMHGDAG